MSYGHPLETIFSGQPTLTQLHVTSPFLSLIWANKFSYKMTRTLQLSSLKIYGIMHFFVTKISFLLFYFSVHLCSCLTKVSRNKHHFRIVVISFEFRFDSSTLHRVAIYWAAFGAKGLRPTSDNDEVPLLNDHSLTIPSFIQITKLSPLLRYRWKRSDNIRADTFPTAENVKRTLQRDNGIPIDVQSFVEYFLVTFDHFCLIQLLCKEIASNYEIHHSEWVVSFYRPIVRSWQQLRLGIVRFITTNSDKKILKLD